MNRGALGSTIAFSVDWTREGLASGGFEGFVPFADLPAASVPLAAGVYIVLRRLNGDPDFLATSPAGRFNVDSVGGSPMYRTGCT